MIRRASILAFAAMTMTRSSVAAEPEANKVACKAAYESAQVLKRSQRYSAVPKQIDVCLHTCPAQLVRECASWQAEIEALAPTVRLSVTDASGQSIGSLRAFADDHALASPLDAPIVLDPGPHTIRVEGPDGGAGEARFTVGVGERDRVVAIVLSPHTASSEPSRPSRTPSYVAFGAGAVLLATAGILTLKGHLDESSLRSSCAPSCDEADVDRIRTLWWTGAGLAAGGVVAVALGVLLWPSSSSTASTRRPVVGLGPRAISLTWPLP